MSVAYLCAELNTPGDPWSNNTNVMRSISLMHSCVCVYQWRFDVYINRVQFFKQNPITCLNISAFGECTNNILLELDCTLLLEICGFAINRLNLRQFLIDVLPNIPLHENIVKKNVSKF